MSTCVVARLVPRQDPGPALATAFNLAAKARMNSYHRHTIFIYPADPQERRSHRKGAVLPHPIMGGGSGLVGLQS